MFKSTNSSFYICECFLNKNYFVQEYNVHINYRGNDELEESSKQILMQRGASSYDLEKILLDLKKERNRRENIGQESLQRISVIQSNYKPLHKHVYTLQEKFLDNNFLNIVKYARSSNATAKGLINKLDKTACDQVWGLKVFTEEFCSDFIEEILNFEQSNEPKGRPNTMNNHGILLDELGFNDGFLDPLRINYLSPIAKLLFPDQYGECLDSHKAFTVKYKTGEDLGLSCHFDNAEITLNVCLGKGFEDGSLYFGCMRTEPCDLLRSKEVRHRKCYGILHRGQHLHGAMEITGDDSERHNLIIWMRSSSVRNQLCPMCDNSPVLIPLPYGGDGFTKQKCTVS